MAKKSWSGHLSFGLVSIPIDLYVAAREERVDLHMLCEAEYDGRVCHSGVKQKYVCADCGAEVPRSGGSRFYALDKETKVVLSESEIKSVDPRTNKVGVVQEFVDMSEIDPVYFGASYYVSPGEGGAHAFALLAWAMREKDLGALAKITMGGREHTVLLRVTRRGMFMHQLFYANEVRIPERVVDVSSEPLSEAERNLAIQLVEGMTEDFDMRKYRDQRNANLLALIERKHSGAKEEKIVEMPEREVPDILQALKASIAAKKKA